MQPDQANDPSAIEGLKRQARRLRLEANRASAPLAAQFIALAERYEIQAVRMGAAVA